MSLQPMIAQVNKIYSFRSREIAKGLLIGLFFIATSVLIIEFEFLTNQVAQLEVGDISPQDITAPSATSYESQIATERAREQAARLQRSEFSRPDPNVMREQRVMASHVFDYLDAVRVDPFLTLEQKIAHIQAIIPVSFLRREAEAILDLDESLWADTKQKVHSILSEVMSDPIRETDLANVRFQLGLRVSSDVPDNEADIIIAITEDLVQPNSFVDEARTEEKRQQAREAVKPSIVTFEQNEIVVRGGERVDELDIEALAAMGLHQSSAASWHDYISTFLWLTLLVSCVGYYLVKNHFDIWRDNQRLKVLIFVSLAFIVMIRVMVPGQEVLAYALPMAALTIILAETLNPQLAMVVTLMMGLIEGYVAGGSFELSVYVIITGLVVILNVNQMAQVNTLLWAGLYAVVSNMVIILLFRFFESNFNALSTNILLRLLAQLGNGVLGGFVSAGLAVLGFLIIGNFTGVITHIQLIELSRPTQPLLAELLRRAPGTYHHTLVVSNLAEQAATRVGANAFLCRVGAYYHDIGKMVRPYFFTENARPGVSLHDNLDPETSAQIIISHVTDGLRLAKENHLPPVLQAFIAEHHGTEIAGYSFYHQAVQDADGDESQVDKSGFTYPGPKPQSRETAILMLADASEATVRSVQPESAEEIDKLVRKTIAKRVESGQFDECDLTMHDLEQIRIAFNEVLQGVAHQRVKYPDGVKEKAKSEPGLIPVLPLRIQSASLVAPEEGDTAPG